MSKIGKIWNGPHKGFYRYASVLTAVMLVFILFLSNDSLLLWVKSLFELRSQKSEIEYLRQENAKLDLKIQQLTDETDSLEQFARETFFFAAPTDDVFIVDE